ncbi:MAG: hypothetical protein ACRDA8_15345 [Shewanella sp.]
MSAPGWIKVHRALLDHWCATEPEALAVWVRLLCEANFESKKSMINGCLIDVERGQLVFGLDAFSKKSGVSVAKLRRIISMLESDGMISRQKTSKYSLISIACYDKYQEDDRQITGKSQANHNQIAAPKEVKNLRSEEDKKDKQDPAGADIDFSPLRMTDEQVEEVKRIRRKNKGGAITQRVANALSVEFGLARAMGYTSDEILTEWELRGWKSLKAEWMTPKHGFKNLQPAKKPKDFGA